MEKPKVQSILQFYLGILVKLIFYGLLFELISNVMYDSFSAVVINEPLCSSDKGCKYLNDALLRNSFAAN